MYLPVSQLEAGDLITSDTDDVLVDHVETRPEPGLIRIHGRITRGFGKGPRQLAWTYHAEQVVDVVRPEPGPDGAS